MLEISNRVQTSPSFSLRKSIRPLSGQITMQALPMKQYTNRFLGDIQTPERSNSLLSKKGRCLTFNKRLHTSNKQNKSQQKTFYSLKNDKKIERVDSKMLSPSRALQFFSKIFKTQKQQIIQKHKRKVRKSTNLNIQRIQLLKKDIYIKPRVNPLQSSLSQNGIKYKTPKANKTFKIFQKEDVEPWYTETDFD